MGLTSGLVVEVGHGVTSVTPIYEGYPLPYATYTSDIGGQDVMDHFWSQLQSHEVNLDIVNKFDNKLLSAQVKAMCENDTYQVNGCTISKTQREEVKIELDRYHTGDLLFNPQAYDINADSVVDVA